VAFEDIFAQGVDNLISQISKSSNSQGWSRGRGMLKFRIDWYIIEKLLGKTQRVKI
jgi:hypothetical protein